MKQGKTRRVISDMVTPSTAEAIASPAKDIDEVSFIKLYQQRSIPRPLVDVVNPQPKAFFAYLQMPAKTSASSSKKKPSTRIKRKNNLGDK